jgi:hypothetical protein
VPDNGVVDERRDLPGYSESQTTERIGVLAVQDYLVRSGFKVTEVTGAFDDGLDLMVSPHDGRNVMPSVAAIQVRAGRSHRGLRVGRHERYWRELNLPVFGVVLADPRLQPPVGGWNDAQAYLKENPGARSIPTPHSFPDGLADTLREACERGRGAVVALDLFDTDWGRQATAAAAMAPLASDYRVAALLRSRLGELGPRATHYSLYLLVLAERSGVDTAVPPMAIARAVLTLYELEADGYLHLDAFHDGTAAAYRLLELRRPDPAAVLETAFQLPAGGDPTVMVIAMAVSLAGEAGETILQKAVARAPNLMENPDIAGIADALADGGYNFSW